MNVVEWLLDSDPAIRWQVMRELTDAPKEEVAAERARVAGEGWGARLLALQRPDGQWEGGTPTFSSTAAKEWWEALPPSRQGTLFPEWTSTAWSLALLRNFGLDPASGGARHAVGLVREKCRWEHDGERFFEGEVEPCINGRVLERRMFRRLSTGEVIDEAWKQFSFPTAWHYDVLRGLDYLRAAGAAPDSRLAEAVGLVESKRDAEGRWPLENPHAGRLHFAMDEGEGKPSRWNTLRAMRVLRWAETAI